MAIRIFSSREQEKSQLDINPDVDVLRRIIKLKVKADGTIVNSDGSTLETIDLGNCGDDWATIINFDISDLKNEGFLKNEISDDKTLYDLYMPKIWFKRIIQQEEPDTENPQEPIEESEIVKIEFNGIDFAVPISLTTNPGEYELIYTLQERRKGLDNIIQKIEYFVSSTFKGVVKDSLYHFVEESSLIDAILVQDVTLKKPSIQIDFDDNRNIVISTEGNQRLGYEHDSFVTDIKVNNLIPMATYAVLFKTLTDEEVVMAACDENNRVWIPKDVTQLSGIYQLMICAYADNGAEFFSNTFEMEVVENFLSAEDGLYDNQEATDGKYVHIVLDSDERIIYVKEAA